jgi:hypothetical protein
LIIVVQQPQLATAYALLTRRGGIVRVAGKLHFAHAPPVIASFRRVRALVVASEVMPSAWGRLLSAATGAACLAIAAAACSHESPVAPAPAPGCTYVVTPTMVQVTTQTHDIEVSVNTGAGCQWTVSTSENWILLRGATSRQGPDVFVMHVLLSTTERRGTVTVSWASGNQSITVTQSCSVTQTVNLSPESQIYLVDVPGCSFLSAPVSVDVPWISALTPFGELLSLSLDVNNGPERSGFVTTALGVLTIVQRAGNCVTAIAPTSQAFDESGGAGSISVTAVPGCAWDATSHNDGFQFPDQVAPLVAHGIGSGVVPFTIAANKSLFASAPYFIVGGSLKFQITQSACPLTVSPLGFHVPAAAADYVVSVRVTGLSAATGAPVRATPASSTSAPSP